MTSEIAPWRLNLLRAAYLLTAGGLGVVIWPDVLDPAKNWAHSQSVVIMMLAAMGLLAALGLRHPLKMLPLLFFELTWKAIWLLRVALPMWSGHCLEGPFAETAADCLLVLVIVPVIPWDHVVRAYLSGPAEPWRTRPARPASHSAA